MTTKSASDHQGKRLTPEQRAAIATAPGTLAEIAEKFGTSVNTVARYRKQAGNGGAARGRSTTARGGTVAVTAKVNAAGGVTIDLSRKDLIKLLLGE